LGEGGGSVGKQALGGSRPARSTNLAKELRPGHAVFLGILPRFSSHLLLLRLNKQRIAMATSEQVLSIKEGVKPMKFDLGEREIKIEKGTSVSRDAERKRARRSPISCTACLLATYWVLAHAPFATAALNAGPAGFFSPAAAATITFSLRNRKRGTHTQPKVENQDG